MTAPADLRAALDRADAARAVARAGGSRPIDHALRNLRHLYEQMISGGVRDTASAARGLLGPAIVGIEPFGESAAAPPTVRDLVEVSDVR